MFSIAFNFFGWLKVEYVRSYMVWQLMESTLCLCKIMVLYLAL